MPEYTTNYNLKKPLVTEKYNVEDQNDNMDILDGEIRRVDTGIADLKLTEVGKGASKIGINDADGNFTSTNVEGALSELFINVSNGKTEIATAITDVDNSLTPSGSDTFFQLADTIRNINIGKKWSNGVKSSSTNAIGFYDENDNINNEIYLNVSGLSFRPSIVIAYPQTYDHSKYSSIFVKGQNFGSVLSRICSCVMAFNSVDVRYYQEKGNLSMLNDGFNIPVYNYNTNYSWIAFE